MKYSIKKSSLFFIFIILIGTHQGFAQERLNVEALDINESFIEAVTRGDVQDVQTLRSGCLR